MRKTNLNQGDTMLKKTLIALVALVGAGAVITKLANRNTETV